MLPNSSTSHSWMHELRMYIPVTDICSFGVGGICAGTEWERLPRLFGRSEGAAEVLADPGVESRAEEVPAADQVVRLRRQGAASTLGREQGHAEIPLDGA